MAFDALLNIVLTFELGIGVILFAWWLVNQFLIRKFGAPYVPTSTRIRREILGQLSPAPGETFLDLGSGDGSMVIDVCKRFKARGIGIEISPWLVKTARFRAWLNRVSKRAVFIGKNVLDAEHELKRADCAYVYLLPALLTKLAPLMEHNLKHGVRIAALQFPLPGWDNRMEKQGTIAGLPVFYYRAP